MENKSTDELATILWNYNTIRQEVLPSDAIIALGNNDIRTARYAAELFINGFAPLLICTGNKSVSKDEGTTNRNIWDKPEAEVFAEEAIKIGVPRENILIENKATNTGENIAFTKKLLEEKHITVQKIIVVQKPFMLRRTFATFKKVWPEPDIIVSSPAIPFSSYPNEILSKDYIISIMVGDTQRIEEYPEKGFQIHQDIPAEVWQAYEALIKRGFTSHLLQT
jgi:uncharacterized SAM-binding protein YcdF (DUF218 family)